MSYGPRLTDHLMREIMSFDARKEPGQSIDAALSAVLTVAVEIINAAPTDEIKAEMTMAALKFFVAYSEADKDALLKAARDLALGDVEGTA